MTIERGVRLIAGVVVLLLVARTYDVSPYWMWLAVLIGLNLLQSAFTNRRLAIPILCAIGFNAGSWAPSMD